MKLLSIGVVIVVSFTSGALQAYAEWRPFMDGGETSTSIPTLPNDGGNLPEDIIIYVDDDVPQGGDGSEEEPFNTINEAIDIAVSGDIILVAAGEYDEGSIDLPAGVSLIGSGRDLTTVDGIIVLGDNTHFQDISFRGENEEDEGCILSIQGSDVLVKDCRFELNLTSLPTQNIASIYGDRITLQGNDFSCATDGGLITHASVRGIVIYLSSDINLLRNNIYVVNTDPGLGRTYGISVQEGSANISIENNVIHGKVKNSRFIGISFETLFGELIAFWDVTVKNNTIFFEELFPSQTFSIIGVIGENIAGTLDIRNNIIVFVIDDQSSPSYVFPCALGWYIPMEDVDVNVSLTYNMYKGAEEFLDTFIFDGPSEIIEHDNIQAGPAFVDSGNRDFHIMPGSPAIDAGDPNDDYSREPEPNGGRINRGAYGNTEEATTSDVTPLLYSISGTVTKEGEGPLEGVEITVKLGQDIFTTTQ